MASAETVQMLRIAEVSRRTGIPVTTLRFYERELPGLFPVGKTRGGHRRYGLREVERFDTVRRLTREGIRLSEVRRVVTARGESEALREEVDLLLGVHEAETRRLEGLLRRLGELEERVARLEAVPPPRKGWLRGRGSPPRE